MDTKARRELIRLHRQKTIREVLLHVKAQGLTLRQIDDILHKSGYAIKGDGTGSYLSKCLSNKRSQKIPTAHELGLIIHALRESGHYPIHTSEYKNLDQENDGKTPSKLPPLEKQISWSKNRTNNQKDENRTLATRIKSLKSASDNLLGFLGEINGSGHDGWDCDTERLPQLAELSLIDEKGNPVQLEREKVIRLLRAANDAVMTINLKIDFNSLAPYDKAAAGQYKPKPIETDGGSSK